jgi:putative ABC transport system substrate-binding protein
MIGRRDFITLLGGAAAFPLAAGAQQPAIPVIGVVLSGSFYDVAAFRKGLNETGYVEGPNVTIEYYYLVGQYDRAPAVMADLVRRRVAVIVTFGAPSLAAKDATATIPIVFFTPFDPVRYGLVASLARPGGNATGYWLLDGDLNGKRLGLLHDLLPKAVRVAVFVDSSDRTPELEEIKRSGVAEVQKAARSLGLQIQIFNASTTGEIDAVFVALARDRPDALFVYSGPFFLLHRAQLLTLTASHKIPVSFDSGPFVREGWLMSYSVDASDLYPQTGRYVGRILKGAKPADLLQVHHQPENRKGARHRGAADAARNRR